MNKNLQRLLEIHNEVLIKHIETKTVFSQFHEKTEAMYETLFDTFHQIAEKRQDIEVDSPADEETAPQEVYDLIEEAKTIVEAMVKEKNSVGMDNLLRGLVDKLEFQCGNARAFINEEKDEEEAPKKIAPKNPLSFKK